MAFYFLEGLVTAAVATIFMVWPGKLFLSGDATLTGASKIIAITFISLGFWISVSWLLAWLHLPFSYSMLVLQLSFIACTVAKKRVASHKPVRDPAALLSYISLVAAICLLAYPLFFIAMPPGGDTTMHGYITRLIINNNSLPRSYRPILPVDYFGSYSAGYHILTAIFACYNVVLLRASVCLIAVIVYPITLLGLIFFLRSFFSEKTAIYTGIIFFGLNSTMQDVFLWGGNPSMLSFGFCLFSSGLLMMAVRNKNTQLFYLSSLTIASVLLTHAIPTVTFGYLIIPGAIITLISFRSSFKWIATHSIVLLLFTLAILSNFLLHFKNDSSPELSALIRNWQYQMTGEKFNSNFNNNLSVVVNVIHEKAGDFVIYISAISLVLILFFKKFKEVLLITLFGLFVFVLLFNSAYWFLPLSEILYPERVVYFIITGFAFYFGYLLLSLEVKDYGFKIRGFKITLYGLLVIPLLYFTGEKLYAHSGWQTTKERIYFDHETQDAFSWIEKNTPKDAIIKASYGGIGKWIPTFTNRATAGTHIHFLHVIQNINDQLDNAPGKYMFVMNGEIEKKCWDTTVLNQMKVVYSNSQLKIYH